MSWPNRQFGVGILVLLATGLVAGACDDETGSTASTDGSKPGALTNELSTNAPAAAASPPSATGSEGDNDSFSTEPTDADGANPLGGDSPEDRLMPDVICMNLQDAQDEIQDHGVFLSRSFDATGQGRNQIIDSNWVVVDQTPAPGSPIGEGDAELSVVKDGETNDC